jgi:hypothetical protein
MWWRTTHAGILPEWVWYKMKIAVFLGATSCRLVDIYQRFGRIRWFHLQSSKGFLYHEDGGIRYIRYVGNYLPNHTASLYDAIGWVAFLLHIWEVPGSNSDPNTSSLNSDSSCFSLVGPRAGLDDMERRKSFVYNGSRTPFPSTSIP